MSLHPFLQMPWLTKLSLPSPFAVIDAVSCSTVMPLQTTQRKYIESNNLVDTEALVLRREIVEQIPGTSPDNQQNVNQAKTVQRKRGRVCKNSFCYPVLGKIECATGKCVERQKPGRAGDRAASGVSIMLKSSLADVIQFLECM